MAFHQLKYHHGYHGQKIALQYNSLCGKPIRIDFAGLKRFLFT